jgi:4-amino-4-deoxy-L-arabinose transferase-like glycosyltransferase
MSDAATKSKPVITLLHRRPLLALFFFCFVAWLPGLFTLPPLDRDESRFAQASKQMLETDNFVDIRFGIEPRYKKPVGIYWLQAASAEVLGAVTGDPQHKAIWIYRVPSLLGAFAAVAFLYWCMEGFAGAEAGFLGALLLGMTLLLSSEAKIAKTDAVLLGSVVAAQAVLMRVYLSAQDPARAPPSRLLVLGGWAAFAIGILIKGPVIAGVCAMTVIALLVWDRWKPVEGQTDWWRWLGRTNPVSGLALTLLLTLPWFIAIWLQSHGQFYQQSLGHDFGAKLAGGQETHGAPPGYYLLLTTLTFWPATLFLAPGIGAAITRRSEPAMRFLMAWAGGWWLLCEIVPTKLPHYILPAYPALALMAALWALAPREENEAGWRRWWRRTVIPAIRHRCLRAMRSQALSSCWAPTRCSATAMARLRAARTLAVWRWSRMPSVPPSWPGSLNGRPTPSRSMNCRAWLSRAAGRLMWRSIVAPRCVR